MKKLIFIVLLLGAFYGSYLYSKISSIEIPVGKYVIEKGDSFASVPKRFNLNVNSTIYKIYLKLNSPDYSLQAGTYSIDKKISFSELLSQKLKKPDMLDKEITILPGWNIWDIDEYLSEKGIIKSGELSDMSVSQINDLSSKFKFLKGKKSLEGFLFPDTYRIALDSDFDIILNVFLQAFEDKVYNKYGIQKDFYDKLILASIVEREEKVSSNKPVVAGILQKRLDEGIAIGADATVCYSYKLTQSGCNQDFINEHIYIKSTYNTRSQLGLPPTPISSISLDTIEATFNQESSPYYYYLHDNYGEIHYAKTLGEHNKNKNLYLR